LQMRITQNPFWLTGKLTALMNKLFNLFRKKTFKMSRIVTNINVNVIKTNSIVYYGRVSHTSQVLGPPGEYILDDSDLCFQHNYCIFLLTHKNMCQFAWIELKTSDNCSVRRSHQNGESSV
jgi:GTP:adenosylcobinamide-phosphate guanylyltransferase